MKILSVNKFYYIKGGSEVYFFGLKELFEEKGHKVIPFSMKDEKNYETSYNEYFVNNIDYNNMKFKDKINNALKFIYSLEAKDRISKLIRDEKPDIAHLNIFQHQISPSIIHELKKNHVPIVNTIHDLKVICPNYKMLNKGKVCEGCKHDKFYKCLKSTCIKGSKFSSLLNTLEAYVHRLLKSYTFVDKFICPSKFYMNKFIEFGIPEEKLIYIPNFIDTDKFEPNYSHEDYYIYVGRLSEEKGISTLIKAAKNIKESKLVIVGTGPIENRLKQEVKALNIKNIKFIGYKTGNELKKLVRNCMFMVIPSEWYENGPMSMLECMAYGKPVIGANIGGIPEFIEENVTGLTFKQGDEQDLCSKIKYLIENKYMIPQMGINAREKVEREFNKEVHYKEIKKLYDDILKNY